MVIVVVVTTGVPVDAGGAMVADPPLRQPCKTKDEKVKSNNNKSFNVTNLCYCLSSFLVVNLTS